MPAVVILFFMLGLLQWFAVFAAFSDWMGLHWVLAVFLSFAVAFTPLIGTGLAIAGAMSVWEMSWIGATALFAGPFIVMMIVARPYNR
ncbi:hypothetical protein [Halomonas mongoliensis]|uniref:hypothetical protein n=1 Tax=Halomonas mongoliensis TaxID=321265 RepID=UPI00403AD451